MLPPCFQLQQEVFPRAKAEACRRLQQEGWSQTRIAKALQVSQTMVSRHARAPAEEDPLIGRLADEVVGHLHGDASEASWCTILAGRQEPGEREALTDLLQAEHMLRSGAPVRLMPQIGLNIAVALPEAVAPDQVMGFPARIIHADGTLIAPLPPTLGSSNHLARCLLHVRSRYPGVGAMANVRGSRAAARAAKRLGTVWKLEGGDGEREAQLERHVPTTRKEPWFIEDPGGFGIEPCIYVCGPDGATVAGRILELDAAIHPE